MIDPEDLLSAYRRVRGFTDRISAPLSPEDCMVQSMPDVSPTRWHLAHTSWFFETFVLAPLDNATFDPEFAYLFNSYYNALGRQFPRSRRGLISRPGLARVRDYRSFVDAGIAEAFERGDLTEQLLQAIELGIQHEQQHQELMLTDIKHVLSCNPSHPAYDGEGFWEGSDAAIADAIDIPEGLFEVGHAGEGFAFDNELPRHRVYLNAFSLAASPVTCGEYLEFIDDGGYERPEAWLSLGWDTVCKEGWQAPLYWLHEDDRWMHMTLGGMREIDPSWPVCHVSYFEADAFARWSGRRLPTEFEWETALGVIDRNPPGVELQCAEALSSRGVVIHPTSGLDPREKTSRMLGCVWEWTSSAYAPYPGFEPTEGALGEYNGKFMCNQYVLRGGSCASASAHLRGTYRNFFPPEARWQFSGIRLAR